MAKDKKRLTKADTDAFFSAKQSEYAQRSKQKVTAEQLQERVDERAKQRSEKERQSAGSRVRVVSIGLGVALLVGAGAVAMGTVSAQSSFEASLASNNTKIAQLESEAESATVVDDVTQQEYRELVDAQIASATELGNDLAQQQQKFSEIFYAAQAEGATDSMGDGAGGAGLRKSVEHRRELARFFVDDAFVASEEEAYAAGSVLPFENDEIDPRFPWYVPSTTVDGRLVYSDPATCMWGLVSVTATTTSGVLDATWLCQDSEGDLYAWASASWYEDSEKFGKVVVGTTTLGDRGGA